MAAQNLSELVRERMINPNAVFIEADDGRFWTYAAFWELAGKLAAKLVLEGARRGDRVAIQVEKSVEAIALFWACARAGLIFLPLNTAYTVAEVSYFLEDAEPAVFICAPENKARFEVKTFTLNDVGQGSLMSSLTADFVDDVDLTWDDPVAILYTSGTTGKSKGAILSHGNLASNALALIDAWEFSAADRLIHALPVYHTHGLFVAMNTVFLSGGTLLFRRKFIADDVMALLPTATALMGVPTFYTRLLQHDGLTKAATAHMRLFVSGSAPLLAETHHEFERRTGQIILERYGMTETNMNTSNPFRGLRKPGSVGPALPGVSVRVTDGMIEVKGPNVFKGYWRNPEKTAADFTRDGYFITGDLGHFDEDGYVVISGRAKDLIITGGFNVYPKELEILIDKMPEVLESAVIGIPHPDFGEAVTAIVVLKSEISAAQISARLVPQLAKFKIPKQIVFVEDLPRNAMGKVQKNVLRERYGKPATSK